MNKRRFVAFEDADGKTFVICSRKQCLDIVDNMLHKYLYQVSGNSDLTCSACGYNARETERAILEEVAKREQKIIDDFTKKCHDFGNRMFDNNTDAAIHAAAVIIVEATQSRAHSFDLMRQLRREIIEMTPPLG